MLSADPEVWRRLKDNIEELRADQVERMARGGCETWDQYQLAVGYVRALDAIVAGGQDILGRMGGLSEEEDD